MQNLVSPQLTASRLNLAAKCTGSQAHEHVKTTNAVAERGGAVHAYIAELLQRPDPPPNNSLPNNSLPHDDALRRLCAGLDPRAISDLAAPGAGDGPHTELHVELGLYFCPKTGAAGTLEGSYHRDYSSAPESAIPGTADVVLVEQDRVRITDWKTRTRGPSDPADDYQLCFLALAAARAFGKTQATVQIVAVHPDGALTPREAPLTARDLDNVAGIVASLDRRVQAARDGNPVYSEGSHCRYCPALPYCPAMAGAAQAILEGPPEELTDRRAAELWASLQAIEAAAKHTRNALQEYVYAHPVPTRDSRVLKVLQTRRESIDPARAMPVIREYLPDDDELALAVSVTKTSLSTALTAEARDDVLRRLHEAGAITENYSDSLREVNGG